MTKSRRFVTFAFSTSCLILNACLQEVRDSEGEKILRWSRKTSRRARSQIRPWRLPKQEPKEHLAVRRQTHNSDHTHAALVISADRCRSMLSIVPNTRTSGGNPISLYMFLSVLDIFLSIRDFTVKDIHFDSNVPYPNLLILRPAVLWALSDIGKVSFPTESESLVRCLVIAG